MDSDDSAELLLHFFQKLDQQQRLVYLKEFRLETPYTAVIGTVRRLNEAYAFTAGYLDKTGVGEAPYEEIRGFMRAMESLTLTGPVKEDVMGKLKLAIEHGKLTLPRDNSKLLVQITNQECQPTSAGALKFTHPSGTHDDCLWALALSVYADYETRPSSYLRPITKSFG